MKTLKQSAIAFMIAGASVSTAAFGNNNPKDTAIQDVEVVDVKAVIQQLIEITPETDIVTFKDEYGVEDWERTLAFEVRRQGASPTRSMPYSLTVSGEQRGDYFVLAGQDGLEADMLMSGKYKVSTHEGWAGGDFLPNSSATYGLETTSGIGIENIDYNLHLTLTIPKVEVETALVGNYATTLTVMVAAE